MPGIRNLLHTAKTRFRMSYCDYVLKPECDPLHRHYHDRFYGFPIEDDNELFGRLVMEINQAGLSWLTILKKEKHFRMAFDNFDLEKVGLYGEEERERLLADAGIIRNKLKVDAAIHNARVILELQKQHGSFHQWLDTHHPLEKAAWVKLFKSHFRFTGGEIVNEFLMSTGYLPGAHHPQCEVYKQIVKSKPRWAAAG